MGIPFRDASLAAPGFTARSGANTVGRAGLEDEVVGLFEQFRGRLLRYLMSLGLSAHDGEEIVQEVFMTVIREPKKFDPSRGTLGGFLYGIARNRVMKHLERTPRDLPLVEQSDDGFVPDTLASKDLTPVEWAELRERREQVRAAVLELPAEFREAIVLCELEEMSYEQAANALDCPIGTIRSRLHRGRALLLAKLEMLREVPRRANAGR